MRAELYRQNAPEHFWRLMIDPLPAPQEWAEAASIAADVLPQASRRDGDEVPQLLAMTLGEGQFGPRHWDGGAGQRIYYAVKPVIPRSLTRPLRKLYGGRRAASLQLAWPVEPRYAEFQFAVIMNLLRITGRESLPFLDFWPGGDSHALVLTHDVETEDGQRFIPAVAELETSLGFKSSFNFVPERYRLDRGLMAELKTRGFEVGVHGLRHDGKLFSDHHAFLRRASRINGYLREFGAVGFRAPLTQRQPEWMQALDVEYDSSFFDTDPYEPIAGGTMSVWPFQLGRFTELPYTLVQDHTLVAILGETTPRVWLQKLDFLRTVHGMALLCTHPDYLRDPGTWRVYSEFLEALAARRDFFHALPGEVARWWRARSGAHGPEDLEGGTVASIGLAPGGGRPVIRDRPVVPAASN